MKKTALVTGANKGIGFEIARQLGQLGFEVFLGARNESSGKAAMYQLMEEGCKAQYLNLDVSKTEHMERAFTEVRSKVNHLDVLINNAGVLLHEGQSILEVPEEAVRETFDTNAFSMLYMTRVFLPLFRVGSRVINISSGAGAICQGMGAWAPLYSISKTTVNAITLQLSHALSAKGVVVNAVCPGWVRTDMGGGSAPRTTRQGAETPVWLATEEGLEFTGKFFRDKQEIAW
jgi:NAD(P)-dependent dehydrogenase (short-subunit alcohol dehydrogenase family)